MIFGIEFSESSPYFCQMFDMELKFMAKNDFYEILVPDNRLVFVLWQQFSESSDKLTWVDRFLFEECNPQFLISDGSFGFHRRSKRY